ncbi:MAG: tetratricopeptide repeat protein [Bacteroidota bacterium]
MKNSIFILLILIPFFVFPQNNTNIDSLYTAFNTNKIDTNKVNAGIELANFYKNGDGKKAIDIATKALVISKANSFNKGTALLNNIIGNVYSGNGEFNKAKEYYLLAEVSATKINDNYILAKVHNNLGIVYDELGDYDKALKYYLASMRSKEKVNNRKGIATSLINIGVLQFKIGRNKESIATMYKAIEVINEVKNYKDLSYPYTTLGNAYGDLKQYDSSEFYINKSIENGKKFEDVFTLSKATSNMADFLVEQKRFQESIKYAEEAIVLFNSIESKDGLVRANMVIGRAHAGLKQYDKAEEFLDKSLKMALQLGLKKEIQTTYFFKYKACYENKKYECAVENLMMMSSYRDSLFNENSNRQIADMETKYETEKKDKELIKKNAEIKTQQLESSRRALQRNAFIVGFLIIALASIFIFKNYKKIRKANAIISEQKHEVEQQKEIIEEKNKEITDSIQYAKRIQNALFASQTTLQKNLNEYFILHKPKDIVSGDFYWANELEVNGSKKFVIATADCTGHGVPGAFMSLLNISFLNKAVIENEIAAPNKILDFVRSNVIKALNPEGSEVASKDGMDCVLCTFDFSNKTLQFACANNPLLLLRDGVLTEYKVDKMPVGMHSGLEKDFSMQQIELKTGDIIYTYTDGYADQFGGPKGKKFKYKPLHELLVNNANLPMQEQHTILANKIESWRGTLEQVDDILVIGVRI